MERRRSALRDVLLLTVLCLGVYTFGPTSSGLLNTSETLRLATATEMAERGDWIVPTRDGRPYLAKPPMIYWAQLAIARVRGSGVELVNLRLAVALAGWAGVLATYVLGRRMLRGRDGEVAWWAALGLAVGVLYVRSSRLGELDIFLVPFVVTALIGVHGAWRSHLERGRTGWGWVALAAVGSALAALTKGPVPLFVIGLAGYGGMVVHSVADGVPGKAGRLGAVIGAAGLVVGSALHARGLGEVPGVMLFGVIGGALGWIVGRAVTGGRAGRWGAAVWRAHPEIVFGAGAAALVSWGMLVRWRIGTEAMGELVSNEVENNLHVLEAASPLRNLEFLAYGLMPISAAAIVGLVRMVRERERLDPGRAMVVSWLGLGYVAFSALGKGVARYLTPLWPALALVGGLLLVGALRGERDGANERRARALLYVVVIVAGVGQAWWYGDGQDRFFGERSARDFAGGIWAGAWFDPDRIGAYEIPTVTLDHYLGTDVDEWDGRGPDSNVEAMMERVRAGGGAYALLACEETAQVVEKHGSIRSTLERAGFAVEVVDVGASWVQSPGWARVLVLRIEPVREGSD